jgi:hypothetical protein
MEWRRDIVTAGRLLGLGVIVIGIGLAFWNATDVGEVRREGSYPAFRSFVAESLEYLWYGGLVLIVTEIVGAVGGDRLDLPPRIRWTVPEMTTAIAGLLLVVGTLVTLWDIRELDEPAFSESVRYFLENAITQHLWRGGMLIALAALAEYITRRNDGSLPEEEEASIVVTEP